MGSQGHSTKEAVALTLRFIALIDHEPSSAFMVDLWLMFSFFEKFCQKNDHRTSQTRIKSILCVTNRIANEFSPNQNVNKPTTTAKTSNGNAHTTHDHHNHHQSSNNQHDRRQYSTVKASTSVRA
jgi:hypothetical protein